MRVEVRFDARPHIGRQRRDALDSGAVGGPIESDQALKQRQHGQAAGPPGVDDLLHHASDAGLVE